jgi:hypothetical protein
MNAEEDGHARHRLCDWVNLADQRCAEGVGRHAASQGPNRGGAARSIGQADFSDIRQIAEVWVTRS